MCILMVCIFILSEINNLPNNVQNLVHIFYTCHCIFSSQSIGHILVTMSYYGSDILAQQAIYTDKMATILKLSLIYTI